MKISMLAIPAICVGLMAMMVGDTFAQGGRRGGMFQVGGMGGGMADLMTHDKVKEELKLEDEQVEEIKQLAEDIRSEAREMFQELREEAAEGGFEGMRERMAELSAEVRKKEKDSLKEILNEDQFKRYSELRVQRMGIRALDDEEFAKEIGLSEDDIQEIKDIQSDFRDQMMEELQALQGDREGMRDLMREMSKELEENILGVLNDEQKKAWEDAKGEEFEFPRLERRRPPREDF